MCAEQTSFLDLRQQALRSELKDWERAFAEANGGQKAGKDDIKKVPDIAAKYKEYSRLRTKFTSKHDIPQETPRKSKKRKSGEGDYPASQHPAALDPYDIPQSANTTPRITRTYVGPTPQKNGQVLGLFDMLSPYSARTGTPSKAKALRAGGDKLPDMTQTPSRQRSVAQAKPQATPTSSAKRRRLNPNQTPSRKQQQALAEITPLSNRLNHTAQTGMDQTPAFLKRYSLPNTYVGLENGLGQDITYSPSRLRIPRKPVGRSLSQLVQSLRDQQDEQLDEQMALMREIETGEAAPPPPKLLVQDSQIGDLPLGADGEHDVSDEEATQTTAEPRRLWKKKGQKRTTRKANIGVNRAKWKPEAEWNAGGEDDDDHIAETQAGNSTEDGNSTQTKTGSTDKTNAKDTSTDGKKRRKINPNAISHANFRSLKIKNKNSKGKKGGRFGRR